MRRAHVTRASAALVALSAAWVGLASAPASAQSPARSAPPGFLEEFDGQFDTAARKLVALAEAMPESTYDWSPGPEVASVAEVYMHIARYNYMYPHENMGMDAPVAPAEYGRWEGEVADKERVVEILTASMEYVRSVAASMSASDLDQTTMLYGREVGQWAVLLQLVTHMSEHLGQSIAYARMNDVVPPWSR